MNDNRPTIAMLIIGMVIFVSTLAAWVFAEVNGISTGALLAFAVPVVGALFVGHQIGKAADAAQQAANQTNGVMESRIESAVASALARRDAARTRQAQGDISTPSAVEDASGT